MSTDPQDVQDLRGQVEALHNARTYLLEEIEELEARVEELEQRTRLLEAERDE
jgi:predicted nuclease with TOPRIM domain